MEARFSLRGGRIDGLRFGGDFLGNYPANRIETALQGCRFTRTDLAAALRAEPVSDCFDGLSAEDLVSQLLEN